ncbi:hypothetical protein [Planomonospora parontospora]|uniref:hypothetical protein n=1 Tax=Planomonospora parontospora TaxID=58119 RepID=UPI001670927F|nr:hypothetical protein [Planomonospora parontospora]GGL57043.1 hypothetical protein GCM10014719_68050 [Planomonospora parontospora subsp. antibiotica]GII20045.1 hypothetical protein Ppa05_67710 [Planomonospora parontospora subsp. antibiotica]
MARYYELSVPPEGFAGELGPGGDRVAALLHGLVAHLPAGDVSSPPPAGPDPRTGRVPAEVGGLPVRWADELPAVLLDRVDPLWLAWLESRRSEARARLRDARREDRLEFAEHVAMLVATPRLRPADPADAGALAMSGAILWLVGTLVATALTDDRDDRADRLADLTARGLWPVGPVDGAFLLAPLDLPRRPRHELSGGPRRA